MQLDIVIPILNEALIIEKSIFQVLDFCNKELGAYDWTIVVVDNGSKDKSAQIVSAITDKEKRVRLVKHPEPGRGRALRSYWLESKAHIVMYMDSDLAVSLEALPRLIAPLAAGSAELSIGSRYQKKSQIKRSLVREITSRTYNFIGNILVPHTTKDLQCGFKAIKTETFKKLAPFTQSPDWFFDTELIIWAEHFKIPLCEIPVSWEETRLGPRKSTVNLLAIVKQFIKPLWQLRKKLKEQRAVVY